MFGLFKKKQPTALDTFIRAAYGDRPPRKSADVERATTIAHEDLLAELVPLAEVGKIAKDLASGPIPYSTHDLAVSIALAFYKKPELIGTLHELQIAARMRVLNWLKDGKIVPLVAKAFEDSLYRIYHPDNLPDRQAEPSNADEALQRRFDEFKRVHTGKSPHEAAKIVRDFAVWQRNTSMFDRPEDADPAMIEHAERIERAFLLGAAGVVSDGYSLSTSDEHLYMLNVVGSYLGLDRDEAEAEVERMFNSADEEQNAVDVGGAVMLHYLAYGKRDNDAIHLAALQKGCWS